MARGFKITLTISQGDLRAVATRLGIDPDGIEVSSFKKEFNFKLPITVGDVGPSVTILKMVLGEELWRTQSNPDIFQEIEEEGECSIKPYPSGPWQPEYSVLTDDYDHAPFFDEKLSTVLKTYQLQNRIKINKYLGQSENSIAWRSSLGIFDPATFAIMHSWSSENAYFSDRAFSHTPSPERNAEPSVLYLATRYYYLSTLNEGQLRMLARRNSLRAGVPEVETINTNRTVNTEVLAELVKPSVETQLPPFQDQNGETRIYLHLDGHGWRSEYDQDLDKRVWFKSPTHDLDRYDLDNPPVWDTADQRERQRTVSIMADEAIRTYIKYESENTINSGWPNHYNVLVAEEKFKRAYPGYDLDSESIHFKIGVYGPPEASRDSDYIRESPGFEPTRPLDVGVHLMDPRIDQFGTPVIEFVRFHTPNMRPGAVYTAEFLLNTQKINIGRSEGIQDWQVEQEVEDGPEDVVESGVMCDQVKFGEYLLESGVVEAALQEDATKIRQARAEAEELYWDKKNEIRREIARLKEEQKKRDTQAALLARPDSLPGILDNPILGAVGGAIGDALAGAAGKLGSGLARIGEKDGVLVITPSDLKKKANKVADKFEEWIDQIEEYQSNPAGDDPTKLDSAGGRLEDATGRGIDLQIEATRLRQAAASLEQVSINAYNKQKTLSNTNLEEPEMHLYFRIESKKTPDKKSTASGPALDAIYFYDTGDGNAIYDTSTSINRKEARNFSEIEGEIFQTNLRTMGYISQIHEMYQNMNFRTVTSDTLSKAPCLSFLSPTPAVGFLLKYTKPEISKTPKKGESKWPALTGPVKRYAEKQKEAAINYWKVQKEAAKAPFKETYDASDLLPFFGEVCTMDQLYNEFLDKFDVGILICELLKCLGVWPIDISLDLKLQLPKLPKLPSFDLLAGLRKITVKLLKEMLMRMLCSIARKIIELLRFTDCRDRPPDDFQKAKDLMDDLLGPNASNKAQAMYDTLIDLNVPDDQLAEATDMIDDLALMLSVTELCSLFRGNPSDATLTLVQNFINSKFSGSLAESLSDKDFITKFFAKLGFISGTSLCDELEELVAQAPQLDKPINECPCLDLQPLREKLEASEISPQAVEAALEMARAEEEKQIEALKKLASGEFLEDAMPKYLMKLGDPDSAVSEMPAGLKHIGMAALKGIFEPTKRVFVDDSRLYVPGLYMKSTRIPTQDEEQRSSSANPTKTKRKLEAIERLFRLREFLGGAEEQINLAEADRFVKFSAFATLYTEFQEEIVSADGNAPVGNTTNGILVFQRPLGDDTQPRLVPVDDDYLRILNIERDFANTASYPFLINTPSFSLTTDGGNSAVVDVNTLFNFRTSGELFAAGHGLGFGFPMEVRDMDGWPAGEPDDDTMYVFPSNITELENVVIQDKISQLDGKFNTAWSKAFTDRIKELTGHITDAMTDAATTSASSRSAVTSELFLPNVRDVFSEDLEIARELLQVRDNNQNFLERDTFNSRDSLERKVVNKFKIRLPENFNRPSLPPRSQSICEIDYNEYSSNVYYDQYKVKIKDPYFLEMKKSDFWKKISVCKPMFIPEDLNLFRDEHTPQGGNYDAKRELFRLLLQDPFAKKTTRHNPGLMTPFPHAVDQRFVDSIRDLTDDENLRRYLFELLAQDIKDTIHDSQFFNEQYIQDLSDKLSSKIHYNLSDQCIGNPCGKIDYGLLDFRVLLEESMDVLADEFSKVTAFEKHDFAGPSAFDKATKKVATQLLIKILIIEFVLRSGPTFGTFRAEHILNNELVKLFLLEFIVNWEFQKNNTLALIREDIFEAARSIVGIQDEVRAITKIINAEIEKLIPKINEIFSPKSGSPSDALLARAMANSYDYNPVSMLFEPADQLDPVLQAYDFVRREDISRNEIFLQNIEEDRFYLGRKLFTGQAGIDSNPPGILNFGRSNMSTSEVWEKGTFFVERYVRIGGPLLSVMRDYRKSELIQTQMAAGRRNPGEFEDLAGQNHLFHDAPGPEEQDPFDRETEVFTIRELKEAATGELTEEMFDAAAEMNLSTDEDCSLTPKMIKSYPSRFIKLNRHHSTIDWRHIESFKPLMRKLSPVPRLGVREENDCTRDNILVYAPDNQMAIWQQFGLVVRGPFRAQGETGRTRNLYNQIPLAIIVNPLQVERWDEAHRWFRRERLGRDILDAAGTRIGAQGWHTFNRARIGRDLFAAAPGLYPHGVWFASGVASIGSAYHCGEQSCNMHVDSHERPQHWGITSMENRDRSMSQGGMGSRWECITSINSENAHENAAQADAINAIMERRSWAGLLEDPAPFRLTSAFLRDDNSSTWMKYLGFPWSPEAWYFDTEADKNRQPHSHRAVDRDYDEGWDSERYFVVPTNLCKGNSVMREHAPNMTAGLGGSQEVWNTEAARIKQSFQDSPDVQFCDNNYGYKLRPTKTLTGLGPDWSLSPEYNLSTHVVEYAPDEDYQQHPRVATPGAGETLYRGVTNGNVNFTNPDTGRQLFYSNGGHPLVQAVMRNNPDRQEFEAVKKSIFFPREREGQAPDMDPILLGEVDIATYTKAKNEIFPQAADLGPAHGAFVNQVKEQSRAHEEIWTQYVIDFVGIAAPIFSEPGESYHDPRIMPYIDEGTEHAIDAAHSILKKWHHDDNEQYNIGQAWSPNAEDWVDYYPKFPFGKRLNQNTADMGWNFHGFYPSGRSNGFFQASYSTLRFENENGGRHDYYKAGQELTEQNRVVWYDSYIGSPSQLGVNFHDENFFQIEETSISEKNFIFTQYPVYDAAGEFLTSHARMNRPLGRTPNPFRYEDKWPEIGGYLCDGWMSSNDAYQDVDLGVHWQLPETVEWAIQNSEVEGMIEDDATAQAWLGGIPGAWAWRPVNMEPARSRFFVEKNKFLIHRANEYRVPLRILITKIEYGGATDAPPEVYIDYVTPEVFDPHPAAHEWVIQRQRRLMQASLDVLARKYATYAQEVTMQATQREGILPDPANDPGRAQWFTDMKNESLYGYGSPYHLGAAYVSTINPGFAPQRNIVFTNAGTENVQPGSFDSYAFSSKAFYGPDSVMWDGITRAQKGNAVLPFVTTARVYSQAADIEVYRDYTNNSISRRFDMWPFSSNQTGDLAYMNDTPETAGRFKKERQYIDALFCEYPGYKVKSAPNNLNLQDVPIPNFGDFDINAITEADRDASVNSGFQESIRKFPGFMDVFCNDTVGGVPIRLNDAAIPNKQEFQSDRLVAALEIRRLVEWVKATWISDRTWEGFWGRTCSSDFAKGLVQEGSVLNPPALWEHGSRNEWYLKDTTNTIYTNQEGYRFLPGQRPVERARNFFWTPNGSLDLRLPGAIPGCEDDRDPTNHQPAGTGTGAKNADEAFSWSSFFGASSHNWWSPFVLDGKVTTAEEAAHANSEMVKANKGMYKLIDTGQEARSQIINNIPERYTNLSQQSNPTKKIKLFGGSDHSRNLYAELAGYLGRPQVMNPDSPILWSNTMSGKLNWMVASYVHAMFRLYSEVGGIGYLEMANELRDMINGVDFGAPLNQRFLQLLEQEGSSVSFGTRIMYALPDISFLNFTKDLTPEQFKLIESLSIRERAFMTRLHMPYANPKEIQGHGDAVEPYTSFEQMIDDNSAQRKQLFTSTTFALPIAKYEEEVPCKDLLPAFAEDLFGRYQERLMSGLVNSSSYRFLSENLFPLDRMLALYALQTSFAVSSMPRLKNYFRPTKSSLAMLIGAAGKREELDGIPYAKPFGNPFNQDVGMPLSQSDFAALFANVGSQGPQNTCGGMPGVPWKEILIMLLEYIAMLVPSIIRAIAMFLDPAYKEMHEHFMTCSPEKSHVGSMTWEHATLSSENWAFTGRKGQHSADGAQYPDEPYIPAIHKGVVHGNEYGGQYVPILGAPIDIVKSFTLFPPYMDYMKFGRVMTKLANYVLGAAGPFGIGGGGGFALPPCADNKSGEGAGDLPVDIIDPDARYGHLLGPFGILALAMPELPGEKKKEQFKICEIVKELAPVGTRDPNSEDVSYLQPCEGEETCPEE